MVYTSINKDLLLPDDEAKILPDKTNLPDHKDESQNNNMEVDNDVTLTTETINTPVAKFICNDDHKCQFLVIKENPNWSKPNGMFGGVRCQGKSCGLKFVHKIENPGEEYKASVRRPMHVCHNEVNECTFAYCHECFLKVMEDYFKNGN
jgi:hypothetical protein